MLLHLVKVSSLSSYTNRLAHRSEQRQYKASLAIGSCPPKSFVIRWSRQLVSILVVTRIIRVAAVSDSTRIVCICLHLVVFEECIGDVSTDGTILNVSTQPHKAIQPPVIAAAESAVVKGSSAVEDGDTDRDSLFVLSGTIPYEGPIGLIDEQISGSISNTKPLSSQTTLSFASQSRVETGVSLGDGSQRDQELQHPTLQPFCSRHEVICGHIVENDDLSREQRLQRQCRERITCCKFEQPYLGSCNGKPEYRLAELAIFALMQSPHRQLTWNQITRWICNYFPYYAQKIIDNLTSGLQDYTKAWFRQLRHLLESYDFPTEPTIIAGQVHFSLPEGREWVFLQRQRTKQRTFTRFCELPKELRDRIYFWALPLRSSSGWTAPADYLQNRHRLQLRREPPDVRLTTKVNAAWTIRTEQMRDLLSITRTCKQIHIEASYAFYSNTHFVFGEQIFSEVVDGCRTLLGFLQGLNARRLRTRGAIQRITLHYNPAAGENRCSPAFRLLMETNVQYLHIHLNENELLSGDSKSPKAVKSLPGMKMLAKLQNVKQLTFSGSFSQAEAYLTVIKSHSLGWTDPDDIARRNEWKRSIEKRVNVLQTMSQDLKDSADDSGSLKKLQRMNLIKEQLMRTRNVGKQKAKRPRHEQGQIADNFDEQYDSDDVEAISSKRQKCTQKTKGKAKQATKKLVAAPKAKITKKAARAGKGTPNKAQAMQQRPSTSKEKNAPAKTRQLTLRSNLLSAGVSSKKRKRSSDDQYVPPKSKVQVVPDQISTRTLRNGPKNLNDINMLIKQERTQGRTQGKAAKAKAVAARKDVAVPTCGTDDIPAMKGATGKFNLSPTMVKSLHDVTIEKERPGRCALPIY